MPALYSHMPHLFWRALEGFPTIGCVALLPPLVYLQPLHKPMVVQLHCVIKKKRLQYWRKRSLPHTRSVSQGTEVTLVIKYVMFGRCIYKNT